MAGPASSSHDELVVAPVPGHPEEAEVVTSADLWPWTASAVAGSPSMRHSAGRSTTVAFETAPTGSPPGTTGSVSPALVAPRAPVRGPARPKSDTSAQLRQAVEDWLLARGGPVRRAIRRP